MCSGCGASRICAKLSTERDTGRARRVGFVTFVSGPPEPETTRMTPFSDGRAGELVATGVARSCFGRDVTSSE